MYALSVLNSSETFDPPNIYLAYYMRFQVTLIPSEKAVLKN